MIPLLATITEEPHDGPWWTVALITCIAGVLLTTDLLRRQDQADRQHEQHENERRNARRNTAAQRRAPQATDRATRTEPTKRASDQGECPPPAPSPSASVRSLDSPPQSVASAGGGGDELGADSLLGTRAEAVLALFDVAREALARAVPHPSVTDPSFDWDAALRVERSRQMHPSSRSLSAGSFRPRRS